MNVATTVVSLAGAPGVGVLPGAQAVAAPGAGPSFADVFRGLSGEDGGAFTTGDAAVVVEGSAGGWVSGRPSWTEAGGEAEAGECAAPSTDDDITAMGAIIVPVALNLTPVPAPLAEVPARSGDIANEDGWGHAAGVWMAGTTTVTSAPAPAAGPLADVRATGTSGAEEFAVAEAEAVSEDGPASSAGPGLVTTPPGGAANVGAPAVRVPGERGDAGGLGLGRAAGPVVGGRGVGRPVESPLPAAAGNTPSVGKAIAATATAPAPETAPAPAPTSAGAPAAASASASAPAPAPAPAPGVAVPATAAVPVETARLGPQAAAVIARLMNAPAGDVSRALALPRALARVLDGAAGAAEISAAEAGAVSALAAGAIELTDAAPALAAGGRAHHPVLAAALRAFQQAGAPAASAEPSQAVHQQGHGEGQGVVTPMTPARLAGLAGTAADGMSAVAPDRRPLVMPMIVVPAFGGDLRVTSDLAASAQFEPRGRPLLDAADGEAVHAQIVQSLRVQWAGGAGEARVRLRPEYLGEVVATVKVEQGVVTATLQADRADVRRWMEANLQTLRDGLVEHGLKLDRLVIVSEPARGETADDKHGRARGRQPHSQPRPRRPRQDGATATFDVNT